MKYLAVDFNGAIPSTASLASNPAFAYERNKQSPYAKYDWRSKEWPGGFGQQVLGETWVNHHGDHGKQSTRGVINPEVKDEPLLRGGVDLWVPTDVYGLVHLPTDAK